MVNIWSCLFFWRGTVFGCVDADIKYLKTRGGSNIFLFYQKSRIKHFPLWSISYEREQQCRKEQVRKVKTWRKRTFRRKFTKLRKKSKKQIQEEIHEREQQCNKEEVRKVKRIKMRQKARITRAWDMSWNTHLTNL